MMKQVAATKRAFTLDFLFTQLSSVPRRHSTPPSTPQMIVTDIYRHRFHRIFATNDNLTSIMESDDIYV